MKIVLVLAVLSFPVWIEAQCPEISVSGPSEITNTPHFRAFVKGHENDPLLSYQWTISQGRLVRGQGTREIDVEGLNGGTATVTVGGLPADCPKIASESLIWDPPPAVLLALSTTRLTQKAAKDVAEKLMNDPSARGYVILYGPTKTTRTRLRRSISKTIAAALTGDEERITFIESVNNKPYFKIFIVPAGATPPSP